MHEAIDVALKLQQSQLGKQVEYKQVYDPKLLFAIPRQLNREQIGLKLANDQQLPFYGYDLWHGYELSWLNPKGKPEVALAEFVFPCTTTNIVESKSFKLYLFSFNQTKFIDATAVHAALVKDLSAVVGGKVIVKLQMQTHIADNCVTVSSSNTEDITKFVQDVSKMSAVPRMQDMPSVPKILLDNLDISCNDYQLKPELLKLDESMEIMCAEQVEETLYSNLMMSRCPVTQQPDWATMQIKYKGKKIDHAALLRYIVSFREHSEFHEQCVERMFLDIMRACAPEELTVIALYTRRGGLDINPIRTTMKFDVEEIFKLSVTEVADDLDRVKRLDEVLLGMGLSMQRTIRQ